MLWEMLLTASSWSRRARLWRQVSCHFHSTAESDRHPDRTSGIQRAWVRVSGTCSDTVGMLVVALLGRHRHRQRTNAAAEGSLLDDLWFDPHDAAAVPEPGDRAAAGFTPRRWSQRMPQMSGHRNDEQPADDAQRDHDTSSASTSPRNQGRKTAATRPALISC